VQNVKFLSPVKLILTFPAVIVTRIYNIEQRLLEETIVYSKVLLGEYVNLQMLEHCFISLYNALF